MSNNNYNLPDYEKPSSEQFSNINPPPYTLKAPIRVEPTNLSDPEKNKTLSSNANANANSSGNAEWGDMTGLSDKKTRIGFIRKVYLIVTSQLVFTFGVVAIFVSVQPVKKFAKSDAGLYMYIASYLLFLTLSITFSICQCFQGLRKTPYNYMLLGGLTLSLTYMLSMISAYHDVQAVAIAAGITLFISLGVTLTSFQTKYDFTNCWLLMICLVYAFIGFGISCAFSIRYFPIMQAVYGGLGAILMAIFLAIDTQLIIGKGRFAYNPEDYVNAALQLYLDICYMFLYLLQIIGAMKK